MRGFDAKDLACCLQIKIHGDQKDSQVELAGSAVHHGTDRHFPAGDYD